MTEPKTEPEPKRIAQARRMLRGRAERLVRLLDLNAPDVILANESRLVADAAELLDPINWHANRGRRALLSAKRRFRICEHDNCEEPVKAVPGVAGRFIGEVGPFDDSACARHAAEDEAEAAADDAEDDEDGTS